MMLEIKYDVVTDQWFGYIDHREITKNKLASKTAKKISEYLKGQGK